LETAYLLPAKLAAPKIFNLRFHGRVDIADIGKPIGAQQRLADMLRSETDGRKFAEPDGGSLQR
jgi:hypothetical protein